LALLHFTAAAHAADRPAATEVLSAPPPDHEQTQVFDEVRFGVLTSRDDANENDGAFIAATVLFDPGGHEDAIGWDKILRHASTSAAPLPPTMSRTRFTQAFPGPRT
jgi:hypothetical protein